MKLAIDGGKPAVEGMLAKFNTIGIAEVNATMATTVSGPLSGYLGGERHGGWHVERLERKWEEIFGVKHAIAVNSGTSGLLLACLACGVSRGTRIATTPYSMSATAAAPAFLGAEIDFCDIEDETFNLDISVASEEPKQSTVMVTNLFGHPAELEHLRYMSDLCKHYLIEDNAQSIFAMEHGRYAGCIGHIGVFSLNVHKLLQCGEGGVCVTQDDALADGMRMFRNHGEMASMAVGLNLRMTEVTAAIALEQLKKREQIISERIEIAETLTDMVKGLPGIEPPAVREGCKHVYYSWAAKVRNRDWFVGAMVAEGVPLRKGYVEPLYRLPAFQRFARPCPVAESMHQQLALYENCGWSPTRQQLNQMGEAFRKVADANSRTDDFERAAAVSGG